MTDLGRLLDEFAAALAAGEAPDPQAYLARVEGADRAELVALLDAHLERAPRRAWDREAFRGSGAERVVEELALSIAGEGGLWPALLPRLRDRARLTRAEVVTALARALGLAGREARVGDYYHDMERGALPAAGVSDRVLDALGALLAEPAARLREAGAVLSDSGTPSASDAGVFARTASPDPEYGRPIGATPSLDAEVRDLDPEHWDEVDRLFRGGP